jgi:tetratricopeptide (TPR) repeat protein
MRDRRLLPIIAVLVFLAFIVFEGLFGDFWMIGKDFFDLLPMPFNLVAYFGASVLGALIPAGCLLLLTYHRFSTRRAANRANEAVKQSNIGHALLTQGEYESAVRAFTAAIRTDPSLAAVFVNRGCAYYHLEKLDEALDDFDTAIRLNPRSAMALGWRGNTLFMQEQWDEAIADFDAGLKLAPTDAAMLVMRGKAWLHKADPLRALADFDRAVACAPDLEVAHRCRAEYWMQNNDPGWAIADFTEALRGNGFRAENLRSRGLCYHFKGEHEKGIADLDEAIRLNPSDGLAFNNRGACRLKLGDYVAAKADLQEAILLDPNHPNAFKNLAWLAATCPDSSFRKGAQAIEWTKTAFELAKKDVAEWLPIMAAAHAEAGDFAEAIRWQTRYRDECPPDSKASAEARLELYRSGQPYREEPHRKT